ncbi:MAG: hypothetical protein COB41_08705 [Proteobacteria bacterium]|nr:MAG: hypothetical protein COB41_08705 [Pseudomonadota bacterium]
MQKIPVLSCVPKKEPKKGALAICLFPSLTAMKRARVTAQLDRERSPPHLVFLCASVAKNKKYRVSEEALSMQQIVMRAKPRHLIAGAAFKDSSALV